MPNLAFHYEVLKQVIEELAQTGNSLAQELKQDDSLMQFAVLGAMGPDIFSYMPISEELALFLSGLVPSPTQTPDPTLTTVNATSSIQALFAPNANPQQQSMASELYFNPVGAAYSVLFSSIVVPLWPILNQATALINQLDNAVQNRDISGVKNALTTLGALQWPSGTSTTISVLPAVIGAIITCGPWMEGNGLSPPPEDPIMNRRHEFLRWHHTGQFLQNLLANAQTEEEKAFAFGWACHFASSVTAEPFTNNIVGGPYRTHWWRNRLAGNFVDSWTYGFFESSPQPTMSGPKGDNPTPPYCDPQTGIGWPSICNANLQNEFDIANLASNLAADQLPNVVHGVATGNIADLVKNLPQSFTDISNLLTTAMNQTYTFPLDTSGTTLPIAGVDENSYPIQAFDDNTLAYAYVGALAVYWFMTSGSGVVGNNPAGLPTGMPEPPFVSNPTPGNQQQAVQNAINPGGIICAIIFAIAALIEILTGNLSNGVIALLAALNAPVVDWSQVQNDAYWIRKSLVDSENSMRDLLVWSGLTYPPPVLLGWVDPNGDTFPVTDLSPSQAWLPNSPPVFPTGNVPDTGGMPLCKTNAFSQSSSTETAAFACYPRQLDTLNGAPDNDWLVFPYTISTEQIETDNIIQTGQYPNSLIQANANVQNGGILSQPSGSTNPQFFGDAVANAVQLISQNASGLLDYNLDADRGYGWLTWNPAPGSNPSSGTVNTAPEA